MANKRKKDENGITFGTTIVILTAVSIILILAIIKIYLSNQIYYESKEVNKIKREVDALEAESIVLKQNVEALKYENQVANTIFSLEDE